MDDQEQQLLEAAMTYVSLLAQAQSVNIRDFVSTVDASLRDELAEYLELYLALSQVTDPIVLTSEEQVLAARMAARAEARMQQRLAQPTLSALRRAQSLTPNALAQQLGLPVDLWQRIERGGVQATTIPARLVERLAAVLREAETTIQAALAAPPLRTAVHYNAQDNISVAPEQAVSFAEALQTSTASQAQKAAWA